MFDEDGLPNIHQLLLYAFDCSKADLGQILTKQLRWLTNNSKTPTGIEALYVDTSGYAPRFKHLT